MSSVSETCGYTVIRDGEEQPCDEVATGWRWYQDVEHEDMLDAACEVHENEGGRRIHDAEAKVARVEDICDKVEANPVGWGGPMAVSLARTVCAALADAPTETTR
jgi:hypothetical protein